MSKSIEREIKAEENDEGKLNGKLIAFGYFGGKFNNLDWLLPLLPESHLYIEPFGGSMAVMLNKKPSKIEVYNDLDSEVVNFFKVLRTQGDELIHNLILTPYSREEFMVACTPSIVKIDNLERARRFYIRIRQGFFGLNKVSMGTWGYAKSTGSNRVATWCTSVDRLEAVISRIRNLQIENKPALDVIARYNNENCLIYCDPPYVSSQRTGDGQDYNHEMDMDAHVNLSVALNNNKSKIALSGYNSPLYQKLYKGWFVFNKKTRASGGYNKIEMARSETVWMNYKLDIPGISVQE